jgi:hypothetical protein
MAPNNTQIQSKRTPTSSSNLLHSVPPSHPRQNPQRNMSMAHSTHAHGLRNLPQLLENRHAPQATGPQRKVTERKPRTSSTESQHRPRHQGSSPKSRTQQQAPPALEAKDILKHPRLQQVTGLLPGKVNLWSDRELPPDELYRLAWAMTLPETFPSKRPRGNF